ncbi:hypothetical protein M8494_09210 [Serratia ureilytica]
MRSFRSGAVRRDMRFTRRLWPLHTAFVIARGSRKAWVVVVDRTAGRARHQ